MPAGFVGWLSGPTVRGGQLEARAKRRTLWAHQTSGKGRGKPRLEVGYDTLGSFDGIVYKKVVHER